MIDENEIITIAENIGKLSGFHARVYKDEEVLVKINSFGAPKGYLDFYEDKIFESKQPIEVIYTDEEIYIVVINVENYILVIGPIFEIQPTRKLCDAISQMMGCSKEEQDRFFHEWMKLNCMSVSTSVVMACADYFKLAGVKLNPSDVLRKKVQTENAKSDSLEREWKSFCKLDEELLLYESTFQFERRLCTALKLGSEKEIEKILESTEIKLSKRAPMPLRSYKNTFIIISTLASRSVIWYGVSPSEALMVSDYYINRCENTSSLDEMADLSLQMMKHFARLVNDEVIQKAQSDLIINVNGYIEMHMSERIMVEQMAKAMGMSRNTLSNKFKRETGIILSEYILMRKIERAKYILETTRNSLAEISEYLAFSSQSHFQKVFKQYVNMTPNEYRNKRK